FLAGSVPALVGTDYGRLLLLKTALFCTMVGIAAVNRQRLTPRLASAKNPDAARLPPRNSLIELRLGLGVLVVVGALGTIPPALHVQPDWPFPVRFNGEAFAAPDLRPRAISAAAAGAFGILSIVGGVVLRRLRWPLIGVGVLMIGFFAQNWSVLTLD